MTRTSESDSQRDRLARQDKHAVHEFCENTSIHGLKYIFEEGSLLFERLFWIAVFVGGISFSTFFCVEMWQKWEDSPILTSVDSQLYPLKNIAFPAVTICSVNKVSERKLNDQLQKISAYPKFKNISFNLLQSTMSYMTKLDRAIGNEKELQDLNNFYESLNVSPIDLFNILEKTAPSCSDIIMDCNWLGLPSPCMEYFSFLPTDDGLCCTFNGGTYSDSALGFESRKQEPLKVSGNGYRMGLSLVLDANVTDYAVSNGKFDGFKVLLHSSGEFADIDDRGFVIGPGTETFVGIKGTSSFTTEDVPRKVSIAKRQCLSEGEKELKYYQPYSQSACYIECATIKMLEKCECRPYFLKADNQSRLCEMKSYVCISNIYEEVRTRGDEVCDCMPTCTDIRYEPEISYATFPGHGFTRTRTYKRLVLGRNLSSSIDSNQYFKSNVAMLHVYYKGKTGMRYRTDIRFGAEDFISAMGGLLGLGLGMSFISAIEILYFIFFRRPFIWYRTNWTIRRSENVEAQPVHENPTTSQHQVKFKKNKAPSSSSQTAISPTATTSDQNVEPILDLRYSSRASTSGVGESVELPSQVGKKHRKQ